MVEDPGARAPSHTLPSRVKASGIFDGLRAGLAAVLPIAALLLIPAVVSSGAWLWPRGLWFVGVYGAISLVGSVTIAIFRPANFRVRQQSVVAARERKQPLIDAVGSAVLIAYSFAWLVFIPLDVFQLHLLPRPGTVVSAIGGACVLLGALLNNIAIWQNPFATPNVQDQTAQGQRVIDTGVYGVIRHPIYASNLLLFGGAALWLGSYAAFIGIAVLVVATAGRIAIEESHLRANLPGYVEYMKRVRSRLIPFVL